MPSLPAFCAAFSGAGRIRSCHGAGRHEQPSPALAVVLAVALVPAFAVALAGS